MDEKTRSDHNEDTWDLESDYIRCEYCIKDIQRADWRDHLKNFHHFSSSVILTIESSISSTLTQEQMLCYEELQWVRVEDKKRFQAIFQWKDIEDQFPIIKEFFATKLQNYDDRTPSAIRNAIESNLHPKDKKIKANSNGHTFLTQFLTMVRRVERNAVFSEELFLNKLRLMSYWKFQQEYLKLGPKNSALFLRDLLGYFADHKLGYRQVSLLLLKTCLQRAGTAKSVGNINTDQRRNEIIAHQERETPSKAEIEILDRTLWSLLHHMQQGNEVKYNPWFFMIGLATLLHFHIGAQRHEVPTNMNFDYIFWNPNDKAFLLSPVNEKRRRIGSNIPIPDYFNSVLKFYKEKVHPILRKREDIECFWLNTQDGPCNSSNLTQEIAGICEIFIGRHVTPAVFRRTIPTLAEETIPTLEKFRKWQVEYAKVVNTSPTMLDMNYCRNSSSKFPRAVISHTNNLVGINRNPTEEDENVYSTETQERAPLSSKFQMMDNSGMLDCQVAVGGEIMPLSRLWILQNCPWKFVEFLKRKKQKIP